MKKIMIIAALLTVSSFSFSPSAYGATPKSLGKFGYWQTYVLYEEDNPICYMSLTAKPPVKLRAEGKKSKRGNVVLMIAHNPSESTYDVVSYSIGTKLKPSSDVVFRVDKKNFNLFTQDDTAWTRDPATDRSLAYALRKAYRVIITGKTSSGEKIADEVSLKGSNNAYKTISRACALPVKKLGE